MKWLILFHFQTASVYCPAKAQLVEAEPGDLQIVCNEYNVDAIPNVETQEKEKVLQVLTISKHPGYSPGTGEDFGRNKKGPFAGNDISVYHVDDTNLRLEEGELWPACLPKKDYNGNEGIFGGWLDQEPFYRLTTNSILAYEKNYLTLKSVEVTETV